MKVTIQLFGGLREMLPQGSDFNRGEIELPNGASLQVLLEQLSLPQDENYLVLMADEKIHPQDYAATELKNGDEVVFLPPIKGG
jgi:molybdopterin converting factor small subunit